MLLQLKRAFVLPWLALCALASAHSLWSIAVLIPTLQLGWLGAFIATAAPLLFMIRLAKTKKARASSYLPLELSAALLGSALAYYFGPSLALLYAAGIGLLGTLLYVFWYSSFNRHINEQLAVGQQLPPFRLRSTKGQFFTPTQAGSPSVILFIRGAWCPLCVAQVRELSERYERIAELGAQVFVVAAQSQAQSEALAEQFDVPLIFCIDDNNTVANELGLLHAAGTPLGMSAYESDTLYPTVIITNSAGKIIYSDQTDNYRVRPDPQLFLDVLSDTANQV